MLPVQLVRPDTNNTLASMAKCPETKGNDSPYVAILSLLCIYDFITLPLACMRMMQLQRSLHDTLRML